MRGSLASASRLAQLTLLAMTFALACHPFLPCAHGPPTSISQRVAWISLELERLELYKQLIKLLERLQRLQRRRKKPPLNELLAELAAIQAKLALLERDRVPWEPDGARQCPCPLGSFLETLADGLPYGSSLDG